MDTGRLNLCVRSMTTATMVCEELRTNMQTISSTLRNLWAILHTLDRNLLLTMVALPTTPEAILTEDCRPGCRSFAQHVKNLEEPATSSLLLQTKHVILVVMLGRDSHLCFHFLCYVFLEHS